MSQILFISDFHLGIPSLEASIERERKITKLLDQYKETVTEIFFLGDIFDFWYEYKTVVPKGYYRLLGKIAELSDIGVKIHFFKGNHDMWMDDLFTKEFGAVIHDNEYTFEHSGKKFYLHHGDGLGPGDQKYKFLKKIFRSSICQFLFRWIHPDIAIEIANFFSRSSRNAQTHIEEKYLGNDQEWLYIFSKNMLEKSKFDFYIFGHRHLPIYTFVESSQSKYINLGDWLSFNTYALFDGLDIHLIQNESDKKNSDFDPNLIS